VVLGGAGRMLVAGCVVDRPPGKQPNRRRDHDGGDGDCVRVLVAAARRPPAMMHNGCTVYLHNLWFCQRHSMNDCWRRPPLTPPSCDARCTKNLGQVVSLGQPGPDAGGAEDLIHPGR
jgi:hypothetical protein